MIKRIRNLKYSKSKNQEKVKWIEVSAKKSRMLAETDWTQLPDVGLSQQSRHHWLSWRKLVRSTKAKDFNTPDEYKKELDSLLTKKDTIKIEYGKDQFSGDLKSHKDDLHILLVHLHKNRMDKNFTPNLNEKYEEVLDLVSDHFTKKSININISNIDQLIEYFSSINDADIDIELDGYDFLKMVRLVKNYSVRQIIIYILEQKKHYYNLALQEEYNLLHYEHRIDSCVSIKDALLAKEEIEMFYGY